YEVTATCTVPGHEGSRDFTACDAAGLCTTETVTTLLAPIAHEDTYPATEDVTLSEPAPGVLSNDEERTGLGDLTAVLDTPPQHGALTLNANGGFTYIPDTHFCGMDHFLYRAESGGVLSNVATVTLEVTCVNDPP